MQNPDKQESSLVTLEPSGGLQKGPILKMRSKTAAQLTQAGRPVWSTRKAPGPKAAEKKRPAGEDASEP